MRALVAGILVAGTLAAAPVRLKDLASIEGVRDNQLIGYGLVVGLNGTGDRQQTVFSVQTLTNLLQKMGVTVSSSAMRVTNTAAVMVTAVLPPYSRPGMRIDVNAAAMGDAPNLQGGILILTSLRGVDGQVYGVAQGPVVTGSFVAGGGANKSTLNHPTVGRIPNGAIIERASPAITPQGFVCYQLRQPDFTTAARMTEVINKKFPSSNGPVARAESGGLVKVAIPPDYSERPVQFIADLEGLSLEVDNPAKVIINERTGTIVMGRNVRIAPVSVMHGALSVEIQTQMDVSQPQAPFSNAGQTVVTPQVSMGVREEKARQLSLKEGTTVDDLVQSLNSIGATARDIIAILQNLKQAGALQADVEVI